MFFMVSMLVVIGVWQWMWGFLGMKVFYADGSALMMLSLMFPSESVLESTMSLFVSDMSKVCAVLSGLPPLI